MARERKEDDDYDTDDEMASITQGMTLNVREVPLTRLEAINIRDTLLPIEERNLKEVDFFLLQALIHGEDKTNPFLYAQRKNQKKEIEKKIAEMKKKIRLNLPPDEPGDDLKKKRGRDDEDPDPDKVFDEKTMFRPLKIF